MNVDLLLYVVATILFILAGLNVPKARWEWLAMAALALSLVV